MAGSDGHRPSSVFMSRSFSARKHPAANGAFHSSLAFPSDEHPQTTNNPLYEDVDPDSAESPGEPGRPRDLTEFHSPQLTGSKREGGRRGQAWTLPARLHRRSVYEALRRQLVSEPADWEMRLLKAELRESKDDLDRARGPGSWSAEPRLTVREQVWQFERQALRDWTPCSGRESRNSLLSPNYIADAWDVPDHLLLALESPSSPGCLLLGRNTPPSIAIVTKSNLTPPPILRPTPPVVRRFSYSISSCITVEPGEVTVEIIPDDPPPPACHPPPAPPSPPLPPTPTLEAPLPLPPPPPLPPPQLLCTPHLPVPSPSSPQIGQLAPASPFVLPPLPPDVSLRPVSLRPLPPTPPPAEPEAPRKELKGILRNIQNLSDIERSVAHMYSQIDRNKTPPPSFHKPPVSAEDDAPPPQTS